MKHPLRFVRIAAKHLTAKLFFGQTIYGQVVTPATFSTPGLPVVLTRMVLCSEPMSGVTLDAIYADLESA